MKTKMLLLVLSVSAGSVLTPPSATAEQILHHHVPEAIARLHLQPTGRLATTNRLHLAIGLPLRNPEALTNLLQQLYDPGSTNYRHYLTPAQFTQRFGPTESDYEAVIAFARSNGWAVTVIDPGRMLVDVNASAADVERVCHVTLRQYQHPAEPRVFFAPDKEPSLDLTIPVRDIAGLDDYVRPHPAGLGTGRRQGASPGAGSGPGGSLMGYDFRAAYAPGVGLDGSGQTLGLLEFDGYYPYDIETYETEAGLPDVPIYAESVDSFDGTPSGNAIAVGEVSLDIEMAISMAPGLSQVIVYEAGPYGYGNDMLMQMANDGEATVISSSWFFSVNATTDSYLQRLAAQGQSFFEASGDNNAYSGGITFLANAGPPADNPYLTSVGGTTLTLSAQGFRVSETVWNGYSSGQSTNGSGGGISAKYTIPTWQQGTSMSANHGSTTMRNIPDVAMAADNIWVIYNDGASDSFWGTSCAAPLWAGFTALVNQQAAALGNPPVGLINPAIYSLGNSAGYAAAFHDITSGNNTNSASTNLFFAVPGYDLCMGWGTPNGMNLIDALASTDPLFISPSSGVAVGGAVGGPFNPNSQTFYLTNLGAPSLSWSVASESSLLTVSPASGLLLGNHATNVTVSLASNASSLPLGFYSGNVVFSNLTLGTEQLRQFTVQAGLAPLTFDDLTGLDTGSVPAGYGGVSWSNFYFLNASDTTKRPSGYQAGMISFPMVVYNGSGYPASILGPVPFDLLSASLTAAWNDNLSVEIKGYVGTQLTYDRIITLSPTAPSLINFNYFGVDEVDFISSGGTLHPGYTHAEPAEQFVMDNVTVVPHATPGVAPLVQHPTQAGGVISFDWVPQMGETYQVQYSTNLSQTNWTSLGAPLTATSATLTFSDTPTNRQRYYRLLLLP
jgi:hypothetical protein